MDCRDSRKHSRRTLDEHTHSRKQFEAAPSGPAEEPNAPAPETSLSPDLALVFSANRDATKPYCTDGDVTMYTETALAQRKALKSDPVLVEGINDFISMYQLDSDGGIGRKEYDRLYHKLCSILRPNMDPLEKKKLMDDEWKKDSQGTAKMSRQMLFESLFELCDVWCPNIDPNEYRAFLEQLKFRIKYEGQQDVGAYDILK